MALASHNKLATRSLGSLLAFLTLGAFFSPSAQAGCSAHYLIPPSSANLHSAPLELLTLAGALPASPGETPTPRRAPCTGAFCSGNPSTPPSTLPSVPPTAAEHGAMPAPAAILLSLGSFALHLSDANLSPADPSRPIFHPPRVSS